MYLNKCKVACVAGGILVPGVATEPPREVRGEARDFREQLAAREDFKMTCTDSSQHSHANATSHAG